MNAIELAPRSESAVERFDVAAVNSAAHRQSYKARTPIYPKLVHGAYRRIKWAAMAATLSVYYVLPWVRWPRAPGEPDQAVLVDFPHSRFYFFFIEIWPNELYFVTGLLVIAALALFLATSLFGRVWCGYACPQTVWTDLFILVERWIEGDRNQRIKLAKAPWSLDKLRKKIAKHILWILIGALTGGAWIFYFHDAPSTLPKLFAGDGPFTAYFFFGLLTATTYLFAGSLREQVCTYMCPWPRIQSALGDAETLQVTYKKDRGEPRAAHRKGAAWEGRGDCVDCRACVAACPMGIDIRGGAQLECINCGLCVDACDEIMAKVGRPKRLIGYDTDKNIERRTAGLKPASKLVRSRTILYATLLAVISAAMIFGLTSRRSLEVSALHDRTPPFVRLSDGSIRNAFTLKIANKANVARDLTVSVTAAQPVSLSAVGGASDGRSVAIRAAADRVRTARIFVTARPSIDPRPFALSISVRDTKTGEAVVEAATFIVERRQ